MGNDCRVGNIFARLFADTQGPGGELRVWTGYGGAVHAHRYFNNPDCLPCAGECFDCCGSPFRQLVPRGVFILGFQLHWVPCCFFCSATGRGGTPSCRIFQGKRTPRTAQLLAADRSPGPEVNNLTALPRVLMSEIQKALGKRWPYFPIVAP